MKSNFEFLNRYWPALSEIGAASENYLYSDPNACIYKLGMFIIGFGGVILGSITLIRSAKKERRNNKNNKK